MFNTDVVYAADDEVLDITPHKPEPVLIPKEYEFSWVLVIGGLLLFYGLSTRGR